MVFDIFRKVQLHPELTYNVGRNNNLAVLRNDLKLTNEDRELLADFSAKAYESETFKKMQVV